MSLIVSCDNRNKTPNEVEKFTVTFDPNGGGSSYTVEVDNGKPLPEQKIPTHEGYTFEGWFLEEEKYDFSKPVKSSFKLVAKWTAIQLTVKFDSNGGSKIESKQIDYGTTITLPTLQNLESYIFSGWTLDVKYLPQIHKSKKILHSEHYGALIQKKPENM